MISRTYSIRLTANLRAQIDSEDPVLSFGYLTILLASIVLEIIATFCENSPILRKFDLFWPPVTSNMTWSKNDLSIFCRICRGLSNTVYRFSLPFLVFKFSGGRASARPPPPPPRAVRRWLRLELFSGVEIPMEMDMVWKSMEMGHNMWKAYGLVCIWGKAISLKLQCIQKICIQKIRNRHKT